mgnify:CR=1 FL=1
MVAAATPLILSSFGLALDTAAAAQRGHEPQLREQLAEELDAVPRRHEHDGPLADFVQPAEDRDGRHALSTTGDVQAAFELPNPFSNACHTGAPGSFMEWVTSIMGSLTYGLKTNNYSTYEEMMYVMSGE